MALHPRELKLGEALVRLKVIDELQLASASTRPVAELQTASMPSVSHGTLPRQNEEPSPELSLRQALGALEQIEEQLSALRHVQEKSDRVLKALIGLLVERGLVTADELKARIARSDRGGS